MSSPTSPSDASTLADLEKSGIGPKCWDETVVECHAPGTSVVRDDRSVQNWSTWKKTMIFLVLMSSCLLADGYVKTSIRAQGFSLTFCSSGMTWGATLVTPQAREWAMPITRSATSLSYGILLQGVGGILAVPFIDAYGRYDPAFFLVPVWRIVC